MARTYTDIPEPRKVLEADTIRGYSRETVEDVLKNSRREVIDIYVNMDSADIVVGEYTDAAGNQIISVDIPLSAVYLDVSLTTNFAGNRIQYGNTIIVHYVRTHDGVKYDTKQSIVENYVATSGGYNSDLYLTETSIFDVAGASAKISVNTIMIVIND